MSSRLWVFNSAFLLLLAGAPFLSWANVSAGSTEAISNALVAQSQNLGSQPVEGSIATLSAPSSSTMLAPISLPVAFKRGCSGIVHGELGPASLSSLEGQARNYIRFRRGQMSRKEKAAFVAGCSSSAETNPYCGFLDPRAARRARLEAARADEDGPRSINLFQISESLSQGKIPEIKNAREADYYRAMKLFPRWQVLESAAEAALTAPVCPNSTLFTALAMKAEEFFPDEKIRASAVALYERGIECSSQEPESTDSFQSTQKARYRLGLLHIWGGDCKKAEPVLSVLAGQKSGDFASRTLYWRYFCAKQEGNVQLTQEMRERLISEFPLSYHSLSIALESKSPQTVSLDKEPDIAFSSKLKPSLNRIVRAAEVLQAQKAPELALDLLNGLIEAPYSALDGSERQFRLYLALLMDRSRETIGRFKVLGSVFREDSSMITRQSLELFYPLHRFDVIQQFGSKLDPYLVIALIRQESAFNVNARSSVGALGLMQLMPATARRMERVSRRALFDAKTNVRLGVRYFRGLLTRFDSDAELSLAAYNAGPERVDEWRRRYPVANRMLFLDMIPFRETREYVATIARNYYWYQNLYGAGASARGPASPAQAPRAVFTGFAQN